jgi:FtsP/CotA-like multicopper oxidase with cupredoxin domain
MVMGTSHRSWVRALAAIPLAVAAMVVTGSQVTAAPRTIELCALPGTLTLPGPTSVDVWGFGTPSTAHDCTTAVASVPGPLVDVNEGDVVTLHVINALAAGHTLSMQIPGVTFDPGPVTIAPGASGDISFTASRAGTYEYLSDGQSGRQTAMGLAGAMVVRPATAGRAYADASTAYDEEQVLVLGAVDPAFNSAPDTFDLKGFDPTYWTINGKAYPDTLPGVAGPPGTRLLLRYVNAGFDNSTMSLLGAHQRVLARDARLVPQAFDAVAETIPAGATEDTLLTVPSAAPPVPAGFPLYNRQLHLSNGQLTTPTPAPGGMLTYIHP